MHKTQEHAIFDNIFALWKITTVNVHVMLPDHTDTEENARKEDVNSKWWGPDYGCRTPKV